MKISAVVPMKLISRRLPNKNFLMLGDRLLASYIFDTLLSISEIEEVYCYTSQPKVISFLPKGVKLLIRPSRLDEDNITATELFNYAVENINTDILVFSQVPGPFITVKSIIKGIDAVMHDGYDSAFSVRRLQTYCWYDGNPVNYNPENISPTQSLNPVYAETSGFYIFKRDNYLQTNSRVNGKPFLVEVDDKESIDIDNPEDFVLAKKALGFNQVPISILAQDQLIVNLVKDASLNKKIRHVIFSIDNVLVDSVESFFGIEDVLNRIKLANIKLSVVSSKMLLEIESIINKYFSKIEFDEVVSYEDVDSCNLNTSQLLLSCVKTGIDPDNTVYVGSVEPDRLAAEKAGIHFIHAAWGCSKMSLGKDIRFEKIEIFSEFLLNTLIVRNK